MIMVKDATDSDVASRTVEKPKHPLTAYNLFFREERARILGIEPSEQEPTGKGPARKPRRRPKHGKISFAQMGKTIAKKWKVLDEETRGKYNELSAKEKKRYKMEMKAYRRNIIRQRRLDTIGSKEKLPSAPMEYNANCTKGSPTSSRLENGIEPFKIQRSIMDDTVPALRSLGWSPLPYQGLVEGTDALPFIPGLQDISFKLVSPIRGSSSPKFVSDKVVTKLEFSPVNADRDVSLGTEVNIEKQRLQVETPFDLETLPPSTLTANTFWDNNEDLCSDLDPNFLHDALEVQHVDFSNLFQCDFED